MSVKKNDSPCDLEHEEIPHRTKKSFKAMKKAEKYFFEGKYGRAMPLLFKYDDCEARAMLFLAYMYFEGIGAIEDMPRGVEYLKKLVEFDNVALGDEGILALGLHYLAQLYFRGIVVPKDNELAEKHWLRGAKLPPDTSTGLSYYGSMVCQSALGMFYSNPEHMNLKKSFYWHKRAQESGSLLSEGAVGVMCFHGIGTKENLKMAYNYLTNSAFMGNTYAKGHLTAYYYKRQMYQSCVNLGRELAAIEDPLPLAERQRCPLEHVKHGLALGCFYLALCCQYGYEISKDVDTAKKLIQKAVLLCPNVGWETHEKAILVIA